jgi:hypothetical protein
VRLHPVVVAVSVIAGTIAAGLLGAVVAVPFVSICWAVINELRAGASTAGAGPAAGLGPPGKVDPQAPDDPSDEQDAPAAADPQTVPGRSSGAPGTADPLSEGAA